MALLDRALNIDTRGIVELEELDLPDFEREGYEGSGWLDLRRMLRPARSGRRTSSSIWARARDGWSCSPPATPSPG